MPCCWLPEPIADAFGAGRVRDVTLLNELMLIHRKALDVVSAWLADETQERWSSLILSWWR